MTLKTFFRFCIKRYIFCWEGCMKGKRGFYSEAAYLVGMIVLAFGTALMERANFGLSMVVAPAYLIHLKVSQWLPFYTFGTSGYVFQALLLVALCLIVRKFRKIYLLSFVTAFLYGLLLDGVMAIVAFIPLEGLVWRLVFYAVGLVISSFGIACLFHTYFMPEVYELFVKEFSQKFNVSIGKTKTLYDCCSCLLAVALSFLFFGTLVGVHWGTVVCAIVNGWLIGRFGRALETFFTFRDALPLREKFHG